MGICHRYKSVEFFQRVCREQRLVFPGIKMAELGNQRIREDTLGVEVSAKKVFEFIGVDHTSFDINGKDGAIPLDFGKPLPPQWVAQFDMVTNFGCIEHVDTDQYQAWRNLDLLCRDGGIVVHQIPERGSWRTHCRHHYSTGFVERLATLCKYELHALHTIEGPVRGDDRRVVIMFYLIRDGSSRILTRGEFDHLMGSQ